eukprot:s335_g19.t1
MIAGIDADESLKDKLYKKVMGVSLSAMQRGLTTTSVFSSGLGFFGYQFENSGARLLASISLEEAFQLFDLCLGDMRLLYVKAGIELAPRAEYPSHTQTCGFQFPRCQEHGLDGNGCKVDKSEDKKTTADPDPSDGDGSAKLVDVVKVYETVSSKLLDVLQAEYGWEPMTLSITYIGPGDVVYIPGSTLMTEKALNSHNYSIRSTCFAVDETSLQKLQLIQEHKQALLGRNYPKYSQFFCFASSEEADDGPGDDEENDNNMEPAKSEPSESEPERMHDNGLQLFTLEEDDGEGEPKETANLPASPPVQVPEDIAEETKSQADIEQGGEPRPASALLPASPPVQVPEDIAEETKSKAGIEEGGEPRPGIASLPASPPVPVPEDIAEETKPQADREQGGEPRPAIASLPASPPVPVPEHIAEETNSKAGAAQGGDAIALCGPPAALSDLEKMAEASERATRKDTILKAQMSHVQSGDHSQPTFPAGTSKASPNDDIEIALDQAIEDNGGPNLSLRKDPTLADQHQDLETALDKAMEAIPGGPGLPHRKDPTLGDEAGAAPSGQAAKAAAKAKEEPKGKSKARAAKVKAGPPTPKEKAKAKAKGKGGRAKKD